MVYFKALSLFSRTNQKLSKKLKAAFWFLRHRKWLQNLYQRFDQKGIDYVFAIHPFIFYMCRMHAYIIKNSTLDMLSDRVEGHYHALDTHLGKNKIERIHGEGLTLWQREIKGAQIRIALKYLHIMRFEGQMSLCIYVDEQCIYFSHIHLFDNALWVGGIQGGKGQLELNRLLTKATSGIRPQNLTYLALSGIAKNLNLNAIYGVSSEHHVYQNENKSKEKVIFNYDDFWSELGGIKTKDGIWFSLPMEYERKPIEDIESKKRSQYKRRYQLMDELSEELTL